MSVRRSIPATTMIAALVALAACAEAEPTAPELTTVRAEAAGGHHVQGSGHVQGATGLREFTFHALEHPDGSVGGSYKIVLPNGAFFEADVSCLAVDGDTGWVGGVIRATNVPNIVVVGSTTMFWARDGGEGEGTQDVVSVAGFNRAAGVDVAFCADQPLELAPLAVTDGNVQVR